MNHNFWKGKKVLLTGHTGFKGSWLSIWLKKLGVDLIGYSLEPETNPSLFQVAEVQKNMVSYFKDIRNIDNLKEIIQSHQPEIIIHMAAQAIVRKSYSDPVETYTTNIMGTLNILEAVRKAKCVKVVLVITSDKCYENKEWIWSYREMDPMGGYDPYSSSKACAELVTSSYIKSFFNPKDFSSHQCAIATARAGNVIGGGDWAQDRLIPDIIQSFSNNQNIFIRYPNAIRPWQHVLEPLYGYLQLVEKLWSNPKDFIGAWNFGPDDGNHKQVSYITEYIRLLWNKNLKWVTDNEINPHEANYLKLDCSKAKTYLGWSPKLSLDKTLEQIVQWYKSFINNEPMLQRCLNEINMYEELLKS